jgi:hypothetical protein
MPEETPRLAACKRSRSEPFFSMCTHRRGFASLSIVGLLSLATALGQNQNAINKAVIVRSTVIKSPSPLSPTVVPIQVQVQNICTKAIYAIALAGIVTWPDGSTKSAALGPADFIPEYVNWQMALQMFPATTVKPPPILRPGETYTFNPSVLARNGVAPAIATYSVSLVSFEDRTVIGSQVEIQKLMRLRAHELDQFAGTLADFQFLLAADDPVKAMATRIKEIRAPQPGEDHIVDAGGKRIAPNEARAGKLLGIVNSIGAADKKPGIAMTIKEYETLVETTKLHSTLQEVTK